MFVLHFLFSVYRRILEQHMYCHREVVSVKEFKCTEADCLFTGRTASELRVHQTTHSTEKRFACTVDNCEYKTKTRALLNRWIFTSFVEQLHQKWWNLNFVCVGISGILKLCINQIAYLIWNVLFVISPQKSRAIIADINGSIQVKNHINVLTATMPAIIR